MPSHSIFKPSLSRALSALSTRTHFPSIHPPTLTPQEFSQRLLPLIAALSHSPNQPRLLASLDSLLLSLPHSAVPTAPLIAIRGLSLLHKLTRAKSILADLNQSNALPKFFLYSVLLQCILRTGTVRDVEAAWSDVDRPVTMSDFIVHMCRHCADAAEIERIYLRISSSRWRVSREAYVALVGVNSLNLGRMVLNEMEERGIEADDLSYFVVFRRFCRAGNVLEADSVLRNWSSRREIELDVSIYGSFFYALCKSGKSREAQKLFEKLTARDREGRVKGDCSPLLKPRRRAIFQLTHLGIISGTMAFEAYFRSLCSFCRVDEAERLLKAAMKKSTLSEICVYGSFVKALFQVGRVDDALKFFEVEKKKKHVSAKDIAVSVIFGLCDIGEVSDACKLLEEMIGQGFVPTARIWNQIIRSYWETGNHAKAKQLFEEMRTGSCDRYATKLNAETYSVMIARYLENGEVDVGISLLNEMVSKKFKAGVDLYSGIVRGLHKCGRVEESHKWLNKMIEDGILVSYESWQALYDSIAVVGEMSAAEFWEGIETSYNEAREEDKRKVKSK